MTQKSDDIDFRRRHLLATVPALGVALGLSLTTREAHASKIAKTAVAYQDTPKGSQRCENCSLFQAPDACKSVDGAVSPQGWCKIWSAKK